MAEKTLVIPTMITVGELADALRIPATNLVGELFKNGIAATINQRIDFETAQIIVGELGLDVQLEQQEATQEAVPRGGSAERSKSAKASYRPPIVAVMGHVDHGKTSLLDAILDTKVATAEAGGITQHISAYQTTYNNRSITLLDTPGHEAFSALRQHGAALTDVVIIVVAADDGVKPQTVEAIKFAQAANAKIVVAITKIDKPTADTNRVKAQLASEHHLNPEEWGGDTVMVEVSAKTRQNLDKLLEMVLLVADLEELKAEAEGNAEGLVIESHMEQGRGPVVSVLVEQGVLKTGQYLIAGRAYGKVRTLSDYAGRPLSVAGPSTPATLTGFKSIPKFGDRFSVVASEKIARQQAAALIASEGRGAVSGTVTGSELLHIISKKRSSKTLNVIVKADVQGSLTSVSDSLRLLDNEEVNVRVVGSGIGNVNESDISSAAASQAIIYGFNVGLPTAVKSLAARQRVSVRLYKVIYELLDDVKTVLEELLEPEIVEKDLGALTVKGVFRMTKNEIICGGEVTTGKIIPGALVRVKRAKDVIGEAEVASLQREKQEAKEVFEGEMCGLSLKLTRRLVIQEGDKLEFFTRELVKRQL
ncbi:MAG: translation initiation factor IF-2 [Candidatus Chaera renei]|uniref:Translation initiation factor IF-2 n=1 Tax=Candidatus Chaera renei TaxID=2506947 RepID=A0A4Q0AK54_9BACT|nr:MAG: translation initiation factor IF-2 [Candidatus Chaera renei]